jgi:hypothetical protein
LSLLGHVNNCHGRKLLQETSPFKPNERPPTLSS